ncbi:nitroreductase/quinone reductase family protein [Nonomuraea sp. NPDC050556]|uniref:nitroreductase/quinone reductase family protein n=1 Tax=Nonomuraea sp. NPDC050556 TaxID=3364369 RepID=UPI0037AC4666
MNPQDRDPREINALMIERIKGMPVRPYIEGGYVLRVMVTRGRQSGQERSTPIAVVQLDGNQFLVAPNRERQWVRNLLADPTCRLHDVVEPVQAVLVDGEQAARVIKTYLAVLVDLPWALQAFAYDPDASLETIMEHIDRTAVFQLHP